MNNILTIDVEDWASSTFDIKLPITEAVLRNTHSLLDILDKFDIRGTFFVLGKVAERFPALILEIYNRGHEVASHGYAHEAIFNQTKEQFRKDLRRSLDILQDIIEEKILGYRAPDFSITKDTLWALDILEEEGLIYDSSIFPMKMRRYGISGFKRFPHKLEDRSLIEFPLATFSILGCRIPACGGGYFRIMPFWTTRLIVKNLNLQEQPAIFYFHPYEINKEEIDGYRGDIPPSLYISQSVGRGGMCNKINKTLTEFNLFSIKEYLDHARP